MGLKEKTSLLWNPQLNAILYKIQQVLVGCLTPFELEDLDIDKEKEDPKYSPGQSVFGCDMFMPINVPIDWIAIKEQKQKVIQKSNERKIYKIITLLIYKRRPYMTIQKPSILRELYVPQLGPYKVFKHYTNDDITYEKVPDIIDKVNIRRVYPYYKKSDE